MNSGPITYQALEETIQIQEDTDNIPLTGSHTEALGGMGGGRPQDAAEPILRPLASACTYLKGRSTAPSTATCRPSSNRPNWSHRPRTLTNLPKRTFDRLTCSKGTALSAGSCAP